MTYVHAEQVYKEQRSHTADARYDQKSPLGRVCVVLM